MAFTPDPFLFVTCQVGAERAVKDEMARDWPEMRFAYSRPGFLTFRLPEQHGLAEDFDLESVFARAHGFSIGKAAAATLEERAAEVWKLVVSETFDRLHVWPRDRAPTGEHGYEPGLDQDSAAAAAAIREAAPPGALAGHERAEESVPLSARGQRVLDCILIDPKSWWVGVHRIDSFESRYPGGFLPLKLPREAVSRAYLKMEESLRWSRLPVRRGDTAAEIGCAPGGSCQALLKRGLHVLGIDPALVAPEVLADPHFTQIRKRGSEVRRREFREVKWLAADMNVAPTYTLDTLEAIVTHPQVHIRGLLITLKLPEWKLAAEVPGYLKRVRSWGYREVRARQLAHNRQEICVAAR